MSNKIIEVSFSFSGNNSNRSEIDFYDVSQALIGFQRSLALTTHLIINDEIITQSPSLKGAEIYALPPEEGSWKITAVVVLTGAYNIATAPNNTPLGHLVFSMYDYVISESLGTHVDYNKSLLQLYDEVKKSNIKLPVINQSKADSLVEKCSTAIKEMHRPIYKTETAKKAIISSKVGNKTIPLKTQLNIGTYEFINETYVADDAERFLGNISSYNSNTFKGRVYVKEYGRPISFFLNENTRNEAVIRLITASLTSNALRQYYAESATISFYAYKNTSKTGYLKSLTIIMVETE